MVSHVISYSYTNTKGMLAHLTNVCTNTHTRVHPDLQACIEGSTATSSCHQCKETDIWTASLMSKWWEHSERAQKNTKAVIQGQIYTGGHLSLSVASGLTYSSDACTRNTQRQRQWFKKGEWCCEGVCAAVHFRSKEIYIWHTHTHGSVSHKLNVAAVCT